MKMYTTSLRRDRRGLEIAMNMVVTIIVAVLVLGIVLVYIMNMPKTPDPTMIITVEPTSIKSEVSTVVTVIVEDSSRTPIKGATVQLTGFQVSLSTLPWDETKKGYSGTITAKLGTNDINGKINVIVNAQNKNEARTTILVVP